MGVTMRDLARRVGVSAVTVSKALAGKSGVSEEMRQRIVKLAEELGYVNPGSRQRRRDGLNVGILVPDQFFSSDTFYAMFCKQLMQTLTEAGGVGLMELIPDESQRVGLLPSLLRSSHVDALVLLGQLPENYVKLLLTQPLPVVALDFCYPSLPLDSVVGDNVYGAALMTGHLIDQGHRDIGFVGNVLATSSIMERYQGFAAALMTHGLTLRPECIVPDRNERNVMLPLALPERLPDAFFCNCDLTARRLVDALRSRGLRVPQDVSVTGYDDFNNVPGSLPLTTFRVDMPAMCRMAVRRLMERAAGEKGPAVRVVVSGEGVMRESVLPRKQQT